MGRMVGPENLYVLGLTAALISSKFEDVEPIRMHVLLEKAGHNRFSKEQILAMERDVLQTLKFKV
jgi:Cyclin, N-terminal domain